ncbi:MAG: FCD domain-containing protein [Actinocatenispora sp.]
MDVDQATRSPGPGPVRRSLSDDLTERVLSLIRERELGAGQRLPSARALAERFAVATPTVREALRRLQATGAVELRHGSGVYVSASLDRVLLPNPNLDTLAGDRLLHLLDARLVIEPHLAGLAASRRDAAALAALRARLSTAHRAVHSDDAALHRANMGFHAEVAAASGNTVLHEVLESLLAVHAREQREILSLYDDRARDHGEHRDIMTAIEQGREPDATELMRSHLADVRTVVAARLAASGPGHGGTPRGSGAEGRRSG